ncbi:MAG: hypothetical protein ACRD6R_10145 [Candidatus Polarisedimenticolia bacterium]
MALRYAAAVAAITGAVVAALFLARGRMAEPVLHGALLGAGLAAVGAIVAMLLTARTFDKSPKVFFSALVAGILGRLALFGGALLVTAALRPAGVDLTATAVALLGLYVAFQVLEVRLALKRVKTKP